MTNVRNISENNANEKACDDKQLHFQRFLCEIFRSWREHYVNKPIYRIHVNPKKMRILLRRVTTGAL